MAFERGVRSMSETYVKDIALTHTPTTRNICIPSEVVKQMGIKNDDRVRAEYNYETRVLTIRKIEGKK